VKADQVDALRRMSREAHRMSDLVEDMLLLARLDEHRPLGAEIVDVGELLEETARDARVLQPDRPVTVMLPGGPVKVIGDQLRLEQVIGELVSNALAYTPRPAQIRLEASAGGGIARVCVSDRGPGMSGDVASRLFDRFVRGDGSRARHSGGAGLGLAIAKAIVEAHSGTIDVETTPGEGTRFLVVLPNAVAEAEVAPGARRSPSPSGASTIARQPPGPNLP
jgi:two-component system, OmpR family, sensor kinase